MTFPGDLVTLTDWDDEAAHARIHRRWRTAVYDDHGDQPASPVDPGTHVELRMALSNGVVLILVAIGRKRGTLLRTAALIERNYFGTGAHNPRAAPQRRP